MSDIQNQEQKHGSSLNVKKSAKILGIIVIILSLITIIPMLGTIPLQLSLLKEFPGLLIGFIISIITSIGNLVSGVGLVMMKRWGLYIFIGLTILSIFGFILSLISGNGGNYPIVITIIQFAFASFLWRSRAEFY